MKKRFIITAALPYTNGNLHIGHLSGVFLPADIYSRYLRSLKKKLIFISGSDEHGVSILIKSIKENKNPKFIINKYHKVIKKNLKQMNISLDNYFRTSNKLHHNFSIKIFNKLLNKNFFLKKETYQYYDKDYNLFLADRFVIGVCPYCKYKEAYSDFCEKCGIILKQKDLKNPKSILTNKKPIFKSTINYFLNFKKLLNQIKFLKKKFKKLKFSSKIIKYISNFIKSKINNRSITRDLNWGVKIPHYKKKVLYVWFEAILGYITSTINWAKRNKKKWYLYWKNKNSKLINFIGKDNIIFHSLFYPLIIKNYDKNYILPNYINVNEFLNFNGKKISTSKNRAIFINKFLKYLPDFVDTLRYTLIIDMPINKDTNFTWEKFKVYNNNYLIGILGNYINRVIVLLNKYNNSKIPSKILLNHNQKKILKYIYKYPKKIGKLILKFKFKLALLKFLNLARFGNKFLSKTSPWLMGKNTIEFNNILFISSQILGYICFLSNYFLPNFYKKMLKLLNLNTNNIYNIKNKINFLPCNHKINKSKLIFKKINKSFYKIFNKINN
ncbi:MAG: methionine--tRNA ligase [Candidatus Shikimatogenerans bostrichidophilus]|nr:MAG: methionine--tRNA ligase [Candidatus Shikimatogenerans bostrichidophilus]